MSDKILIVDIQSRNVIAEYKIIEAENESNEADYKRAWDSAVAEGKVQNEEKMNYIVLRIAQ